MILRAQNLACFVIVASLMALLMSYCNTIARHYMYIETYCDKTILTQSFCRDKIVSIVIDKRFWNFLVTLINLESSQIIPTHPAFATVSELAGRTVKTAFSVNRRDIRFRHRRYDIRNECVWVGVQNTLHDTMTPIIIAVTYIAVRYARSCVLGFEILMPCIVRWQTTAVSHTPLGYNCLYLHELKTEILTNLNI